jgi:hypothetical protein
MLSPAVIEACFPTEMACALGQEALCSRARGFAYQESRSFDG